MFGVKTYTFWGSRDVIGYVTIGFSVGGFLMVFNDDHASILHCYGDMGSQRFWGHNLDLLGSRDVIGNVTNLTCRRHFPIGGSLWSYIASK